MRLTADERRQEYLAWREGTEWLHAFWQRKGDLSRELLASPEVARSLKALQWFEVSVLAIEQHQLWNQRFCLLMLLRTRASGGV